MYNLVPNQNNFVQYYYMLHYHARTGVYEGVIMTARLLHYRVQLGGKKSWWLHLCNIVSRLPSSRRGNSALMMLVRPHSSSPIKNILFSFSAFRKIEWSLKCQEKAGTLYIICDGRISPPRSLLTWAFAVESDEYHMFILSYLHFKKFLRKHNLWRIDYSCFQFKIGSGLCDFWS